jgi:hypothetical protein
MAFAKTNDNSAVDLNNQTTITTTLTATAGDFIFVAVRGGNSTITLSSVSDPTNGAYTIKQTVNDGTNDRRTTVAYFSNSAALSGATITATLSSAQVSKYIYAAAWAGADTAAFDVQNGNWQAASGTSTDGVTSNAATTTAIDLILGVGYDSTRAAANSINAGTGFTLDLDNFFSATHCTLTVEHLTQSGAGSQAATFTTTNNDSTTAIMMAVKPAAVVGANAPSVFDTATVTESQAMKIHLNVDMHKL